MTNSFEMKDNLGDAIVLEVAGDTIELVVVDGDYAAAADLTLAKARELARAILVMAGDLDGGHMLAPHTGKEPKARPHGKQEYKGNGNHEWEHVPAGSGDNVYRLRVPGGWLYSDSRSTTFVPLAECIGYAI